VIAAAPGKQWGERIELIDGQPVTVHRLRSYRLLQHKSLRFVSPVRMRARIASVLRRVKPDALHLQSHLWIGRFAVRAASHTGVRLIATNHIMPENLIKYSLLPRWLEAPAMRWAWRDAGRIMRKMDAVTTPTRRAAELLEKAAGLSGVRAISCGIDAAKFANPTATSNAKPRVLFVGRLDAEKRADVLIRAFAKLTDIPGSTLELIGDGGERKNFENLATTLGVGDRVRFLGHVTDTELQRAYERCTVFVMPSIAELQSIATMEAMASGRPVIGADAMALPHLVHDGDNGYLFPPDDADALSERLRRVLTASSAELERMSENSLHLIQSHDIERTVAIFNGLYRGAFEHREETYDNLPEYLKPIGRLSDALRSRVSRWREELVEMRERAEAQRERTVELVTELAVEVKDQIVELGQDVAKAAKRLRRKRDLDN
jgi:glycosyltransferase involved in cell wall biosynthesis